MTEREQQQLFREWAEAYRGIVFKTARAFARESDQDDLAQEILLHVWRAIPAYRQGAKPSTFVYRVAHNTALNWHRRRASYRARLERYENDPAFSAEDRSAAPSGAEARIRALYEAIRQLPEADRSLVLLHLDGVSYAEMAEVMGLSESNVGARLTRIRKKLATLLKEDLHEDE